MATKKKLGIHTKKSAKQYSFVDTTQNTKASKTLEKTLFAAGRINGVIEYCFSGHRFKIRLDDESCLIALMLEGVKSAAPDANSVEVSELAEVSKKFARDNLHQRDVEIEI